MIEVKRMIIYGENNWNWEGGPGTRELNLSEQYALIALEGQESLHRSVAKCAVLRAVTAAEVLMPVLEKEGCSLSEFAEEAEKAVQAAKNMNKKEERQIEQKVKEYDDKKAAEAENK